MPAAKKTKRTAAKANARDNKLYRKFEGPNAEYADEPDFRDYLRQFFYERRHLATAIDPNGNWRRLKYQIELDEMEEATCDGLQRIYKRDGAEIFKEVSRELLIGLLDSIEYVGGDLPKQWRGMLKELATELKQEDDQVLRRSRRGEPAIAA